MGLSSTTTTGDGWGRGTTWPSASPTPRGIDRSILQRKHAVVVVDGEDDFISGMEAWCLICHKQDYVERSLRSLPIAQRMRWVGDRETTREEYMAYSLLGLFGVNMPLLYGEGAKSFHRLLAAIIRNGADQFILLWNLPWWKGNYGKWNLALSPDPSYYDIDLNLMRNPDWEAPEITATPHGLELDVFIAPCPIAWRYEGYYVAILSRLVDYRLTAAGIVVKPEARAKLSADPIIY